MAILIGMEAVSRWSTYRCTSNLCLCFMQSRLWITKVGLQPERPYILDKGGNLITLHLNVRRSDRRFWHNIFLALENIVQSKEMQHSQFSFFAGETRCFEISSEFTESCLQEKNTVEHTSHIAPCLGYIPLLVFQRQICSYLSAICKFKHPGHIWEFAKYIMFFSMRNS